MKMNAARSATRLYVLSFALFAAPPGIASAGALPEAVVFPPVSAFGAPIEIGTMPQLFVDDYLVDNRYAARNPGREMVLRHFHVPSKFAGNPVLIDPETTPSHANVQYDREARLFKMWYQGNVALTPEERPRDRGTVFGFRTIRYAESRDGIHWILPSLGLYEFRGSRANNICLAHQDFGQSYRQALSSVRLLDLNNMPEPDRRGYRFLMTYTLRGGGPNPDDKDQVWLIGSQNGIHWDRDNQITLGMTGMVDGWMGLVYDPQRKKYVAWARPRDRYHNGRLAEDNIYRGIVRRSARMESDVLWKDWGELRAETVFQPDEIDHRRGVTAHMNLSVHWAGGVYFGFLQPYVPRELLWTELVLSRDGIAFERVHEPMLIPTSPTPAWDGLQTWGLPQWVEVGDEWWNYYFGTNAEPNVYLPEGSVWGIGLTKIRKEGFVSMRSPPSGGIIVTRLLKWPGGGLIVNADASPGELRVRVSDINRIEIPGFGYDDCVPVKGDGVAHRVEWKGRFLEALQGREIRLEFYFKNAGDLYAFRAAGPAASGSR